LFCNQCGSDLPDDSRFCHKCGYSFSALAPRGPVPAATRAKPSSTRVFAILAIALPLLGILIWTAASHGTALKQLERLTKKHHSQVLDNSALTVDPVEYAFFDLVVPAGATGVHLQGNFTASGGSGNDTEAHVFSDTDFANWKNGHESKTYYSSGRVTVGNFNVDLPDGAGTYDLVFDNRFSLLSKKTVSFTATLSYYQ